MRNRKRLFFSFFLLCLFVSCFCLVGFSTAQVGNPYVTILSSAHGHVNFMTPAIDGSAGFQLFQSNLSLALPYGQQFTIEAVADSGYVFDHFDVEGVVSGETDLQTFGSTVVSSFKVTANFVAESGNHAITLTDVGATGESHGGVIYNGNTYSFTLGTLTVSDGVSFRVDAFAEPGQIYLYTQIIGGSLDGYYYNADQNFSSTTGITEIKVYFGEESNFVTPAPSSGGVNWIDGVTSADFGKLPMIVQMLLAFIVVFGLPMCLVVLVPKAGMVGFAGTMALAAAVGVFFLGLPPYLLIVAVLGVGLMIFSLVYRG